MSLEKEEHCPDTFVEVLFTHYEDEDAHILVFVPEDTDETATETLRALLTQLSAQLLDDMGLLILVRVYGASERRQLTGKPAMESQPAPRWSPEAGQAPSPHGLVI